MTLAGKTLFITGATRGIGKAIALRAARDGASIAVLGKTDAPHPKLEGTVHDTVREIEAAGGKGLACVADVRLEEQVLAAVEATVRTFGGIDILVNNASAIQLTGTLATEMKRFDLMQQVNARGTFLCSRACIPELAKRENPHILMLAPPPTLDPRWYGPHLAYTLSKLGMSLCVLGLSEELRPQGIGVNALWPRTAIATAAVANLLGGAPLVARARHPTIVADAAHAILTRPARQTTGRFFIDDEVLKEAGVTDFEQYAVTPGTELAGDFFSEVRGSREAEEMVRGAMLQGRVAGVKRRGAALAAALVLLAPAAHAEEPSFSDRFFRGTSPGELPTEKLALVAGLYVASATSLSIGVVTLVGASAKHDDAESFKRSQPPGFCNNLASPSCASYRHLLGDERSRRETGFLLLGLGGLLALGGGITAELWHNDAGPEVALSLGDGGMSLGVRGAF